MRSARRGALRLFWLGWAHSGLPDVSGPYNPRHVRHARAFLFQSKQQCRLCRMRSVYA